jgi:hypothetical protein
MSHEFVGKDHGGVGISFFVVIGEPGQGPRLHRHDYDEIVYIIEGRSKWTVGDQEREKADSIPWDGSPTFYANRRCLLWSALRKFRVPYPLRSKEWDIQLREGRRILLFPKLPLIKTLSLFPTTTPRHSLLQNLHRQRKLAQSRLADQQMKVLGHHHVAGND